jgi:hypothetical protein
MTTILEVGTIRKHVDQLIIRYGANLELEPKSCKSYYDMHFFKRVQPPKAAFICSFTALFQQQSFVKVLTLDTLTTLGTRLGGARRG